MELSVQTRGPNARTVQQEIKAFFSTEYGDDISITETTISDTDVVRGDPGTILAIVGIIIGLPGALLAVLDLRERAKQKERLESFVTKSRSLMVSSEDHATITINQTDTIYLRDASSEKLFDALMDAARKEQERG